MNAFAMDVNTDGAVTAADALEVINDLGQNGSREVDGESVARLRDTNRDGTVSSMDALTVINHMNRNGARTIDLRDLMGQRGDLISDAQKENVRQLLEDLNAIRADRMLRRSKSLSSLTTWRRSSENATPPSEESVSQLVENTRDAADDGEFTPEELARLASDVQVVLESAEHFTRRRTSGCR